MSQRKSETARTNGAKSQGPVTPKGRARSSQNSLRHGLRSEMVVLPGEDPEEYQRHRAGYLNRFQPADQPEMDLVETMAAARWRLNRLMSLETRLFELETIRNIPAIDKEFKDVDAAGYLAWTVNKMARDGPAAGLLLRYEARINRTYEQAFKHLQQLQAVAPASAGESVELPNEPKPLPVPAPPPHPNEPDSPPSPAPEAITPQMQPSNPPDPGFVEPPEAP